MESSMDEKVHQALQRPFDKQTIRERIGPGGRPLSYVPVSHYIARLNEATAGEWSYEVLSRERLEDEVIVEVRLNVMGVIKTGLGGAPINRRRDNGKTVSLAHDYMSAEASALKR